MLSASYYCLLLLVVAVAVLFNDVALADQQHHPKTHAEPVKGIDWDSFGFSLNGVQTDYMWVDTVPVEERDMDDIDAGGSDGDGEPTSTLYSTASEEDGDGSDTGRLRLTGTIELSPSATVLNYGQGLFEGLKAFRREDGSIVVFRPDRNARRMSSGARRFLLPPVPTTTFLAAMDSVVRSNARWVPPHNRGALYLRPLLMGTGPGLGVKPSTQSTFCIYCSPVGNYFKGDLKSIKLQAVRGFCRAAPGGAGNVKAIGNYAPAFLVQRQVRQQDDGGDGGAYDEVLCLDALTGEGIEEAGASNFFAVYPNNTIVTPSLNSGTILPGVTRESILELAENECDCTVVEGRLTLGDLKDATEAFCCGTGACITPVGCVGVLGKSEPDEDGVVVDQEVDVITFGEDGEPGPLTRKLYRMLTDIQKGTDHALAEKYKHWIHVVDP